MTNEIGSVTEAAESEHLELEAPTKGSRISRVGILRLNNAILRRVTLCNDVVTRDIFLVKNPLPVLETPH